MDCDEWNSLTLTAGQWTIRNLMFAMVRWRGEKQLKRNLKKEKIPGSERRQGRIEKERFLLQILAAAAAIAAPSCQKTADGLNLKTALQRISVMPGTQEEIAFQQ